MMSLVADYSASSSSDTENENSEDTEKTCPTVRSVLPSASSLLTGEKAGEVFQNRFKQEELNKKASLEHHVKMVESDEHLKIKNGRKICWNHRKGSCRFGSKCQYAHDSDLVSEPILKKTTTEINSHINKIQENSNDEELVAIRRTPKRKRAGLGDSIIPGKRVINAYKQQKKH